MSYDKEEYVRYRLNAARDKLKSAEILFENGQYNDSVSRSYYAMFSAARAVLALASLESKKHSGVISLFNRYVVKAKKVEKEVGRLLKEAKDLREGGDYDDFFVVSKELAQKQLENARLFVDKIENTISNLMI